MKPTVITTSLLLFLVAGDAAAEDCYLWPANAADEETAADNADALLESALAAHTCVLVKQGVWKFHGKIVVPADHHLKGVGMYQSVLRAVAPWAENPAGGPSAALVENPSTGGHANVSDLTVDANFTAVLAMSARELTIERVRVRGAKCDGITINGYGMEIRNSVIEANGLDCPHPDYPNVNINGAGIYATKSGPVPASYAPIIDGNQIVGNFGAGVDVDAVWYGQFTNNIVQDNDNWAAVSLAGSSHWLIANNVIHHPASNSIYPWDTLVPRCVGGPSGARSSALLLCMTEDTYNTVSTENEITGNTVSGGHGILLIGNDEDQPYLVPRGNTVHNNNVSGSVVGCADDFNPAAQALYGGANDWSGNNCQGGANTLPDFF